MEDKKTSRYFVGALLLLIASMAGYLVFIYPQSARLQSISPWTLEDNMSLANEHVEILGVTPENTRPNYKLEVPYNNILYFYSNDTGNIVGYQGAGGLYYIENNKTYGPFRSSKSYPTSEEMEQVWESLEAAGWKTGMRELNKLLVKEVDSKSGHSIETVPTGPSFRSIDMTVQSQSKVIYDGHQIGLHTIQDGSHRSPVIGVLLSQNGLHWIYLVRAKHGYFVVVDGKKSKLYPTIMNVHFEENALVFNVITSDLLNFARIKINTD